MDSNNIESNSNIDPRPMEKVQKKTPRLTKLVLIFETSFFIVCLFLFYFGARVFLGIFSAGSFLFFLILTFVSLFSRNLRPTFWLPANFVFCFIFLLVFILVTTIPLEPPEETFIQPPEIAEELDEIEDPIEDIEETAEEEPIEEREPGKSIRDCINSIIETVNVWLSQLGLEIPLLDK